MRRTSLLWDHTRSVCPGRLGFQESDKLISPDVEKEVTKPAAFLDRNRVGDDRLESQNILVKLTGLVEGRASRDRYGKIRDGSWLVLLALRLLTTVSVQQASSCRTYC